jgi:hypothetical protein
MATAQVVGTASIGGAGAYYGYKNLTIFTGTFNNAVNFFSQQYGVAANQIKNIFKLMGFGTLSEKMDDNRVKYHQLLHQTYAAGTNIDPAFGMGIEWVETRGVENKVTDTGMGTGDYACGPMQMTLSTARQFDSSATVDTLKIAENGIRLGYTFLQYLYNKYGPKMEDVINAYRSGQPGTTYLIRYVIPVMKKASDFSGSIIYAPAPVAEVPPELPEQYIGPEYSVTPTLTQQITSEIEAAGQKVSSFFTNMFNF